MIKTLKKNELFVFGSNLSGSHGGGAAKKAYIDFGAEWGISRGRTGQCYAFPTLDENLEKLSDEQLKKEVSYLYEYCEGNKDTKFILTAVGTGIAGFSIEYMKSLFVNPPKNIILPKEFN